MYQLLWIFFLYAFLGWCTEVSYAALRTGRFVNRGFLNGPVCPIYGCGVVVVLAGLPTAQNIFSHAVRYQRSVVLARDVVFITSIGSIPSIMAMALLLG